MNLWDISQEGEVNRHLSRLKCLERLYLEHLAGTTAGTSPIHKGSHGFCPNTLGINSMQLAYPTTSSHLFLTQRTFFYM